MNSLVGSYGTSDEDEDMDTDDHNKISAVPIKSTVVGSIAGANGRTFDLGPKLSSLMTTDELSDDEDEDESVEYEDESVEHEDESVEHEDESVEHEDESVEHEEPHSNDLKNTTMNFNTFLPKPKILVPGSTTTLLQSTVEEEIGPIPPKKIYGDEEKPKPLSFHNITTKRSAKGIIQISLPFTKELAEEEDDSTTKKKIVSSSQKGTGLFALLPEPQNDGTIILGSTKSTPIKLPASSSPPSTFLSTKSLVPHSVQQAGKRSAPVNERLAQVRAKYMKQEANVRIISKSKPTTGTVSAGAKPEASIDDSDEESESTDFFSLDTAITTPVVYADKVEDSTGDVRLVNSNPDVEDWNPRPTQEQSGHPTLYDTPSASTVESTKDDWMKYIHQPKKGKAKLPEINIIDVNADDLRSNTSDWLKTLTDTSLIPPRKAALPGGLSKKKHQITYLAAEAKAREEELQNQWAANKHSRRATQNKYGF